MSGWGEPLELGDATGAELAQALERRPTGFGEYLGAKMGQSWTDSPGGAFQTALQPGMAGTRYDVEGRPNPAWQDPDLGGFQPPGERGIGQDEFKGLIGDRKIPFDPYMSRERVRTLVEMADDAQWRAWQIEQRRAGPVGGTIGFAAGMATGVADPTSYLGFGAAWRWAQGAKQLTRSAMIARSAAVGATENAAVTALFEPMIMAHRAAIGDDMSFGEATLDIVMGGLLGGAMGGGAGWWHSRGLVPDGHPGLMPPAEDLQRAGEIVDLAVGEVIADRPVAVAGPFDRFRDNLLGDTAVPGPIDLGSRAVMDEPLAGAEATIAPPAAAPGAAAFLRKQGGLRRTSEMDLDWKETQKARPGLVSRRGLGVDEAARHLINAGYLPERLGTNDADRGAEIVELLRRDVAGEDTRPVDMRGLDKASREVWGERHSIDRALIAASEPYGGLSGNELAIARRLVEEQEFDDEDAIVQALTHAALRDDEGRLLEAAGLAEDAFDIPFDDLPRRAAEGAGERAGQPGPAEPGAAGGRGAAGEGAGAAPGAARGYPGARGIEPGTRAAEPATTAAGRALDAAPDLRSGSAEAVAPSIHEQIRRFVAGEVEASRAPRPLSDASPGRPVPDPAAEVKAELERPEPEPFDDKGDFPELLDYQAALADGQVAPEERAAVEAASAEVERLARIEQAHDQAALCILGGLG